jgi:hypothetical protein
MIDSVDEHSGSPRPRHQNTIVVTQDGVPTPKG